MPIKNNEKDAHVENIKKSINWLIEKGLWDEVEKIMKHCVTEATCNVLKKKE